MTIPRPAWVAVGRLAADQSVNSLPRLSKS